MTDVGRTEAGPEARDAARTIVGACDPEQRVLKGTLRDNLLHLIAAALARPAAPAAPEDEGIASVDMRRALLAARPVLETCRTLFGGRGLQGPGALEDDCAFALRQIDAALKAPEDDAGPLDRSRLEDSPAPVPDAGRPTVDGFA